MLSGRRQHQDGQVEFLRDLWEYDPSRQAFLALSCSNRYAVPNEDFSNVVPASSFRTGDLVEVRLDYQDRVDRVDTHCPMEGPCETPAGSGCWQRVTWTVDIL